MVKKSENACKDRESLCVSDKGRSDGQMGLDGAGRGLRCKVFNEIFNDF